MIFHDSFQQSIVSKSRVWFFRLRNEVGSDRKCLTGFYMPLIWHLGQGIQEWTKQNLWKTAFKKFEVMRQIVSLQIFWRLPSTSFTWSIFEYFAPFFLSQLLPPLGGAFYAFLMSTSSLSLIKHYTSVLVSLHTAINVPISFEI